MVDGFSSTLLSFCTIPVYSICIRSFFKWCIFRRRYGVAAACGCLPGYTFYRVVSGERLCRSYCIMAGVYRRLCTWAYSFTTSSSSNSGAEDDDDDDGDDDAVSDDDGDASSIDEMSTWHSTIYHSWQKGEVVFDMRVVTLRGRVSFWDHCVRGSVVIFFFWGM